MESKARVFGHSLHQILIVYPLGLLTTSIGFDAVAILRRDGRWSAMAYYIILVGLLGGVAAIVCGYIDYRAIPAETRAKQIGRLHGLGGAFVMLFFGAGAYFRSSDPFAIHPSAIACSVIGVVIIGVTGWLGGELVTRMGVGVVDGAHLDMPSSLTLPGSQSAPHTLAGGEHPSL